MFQTQITSEKISPEGGRKLYMYVHYYVIHKYFSGNNEWLMKDTVIASFHNHDAKWYFSTDSSVYWEQRLVEFTNNPDRLKKLEDFITKTSEDSISFLKGLDLQKMSNSELSFSLQKYFDHFETLLHAPSILRLVDRGVIQRISQNSSLPNIDEFLRTISINTRPSFFFQEEKDTIVLAEKMLAENLSVDSKEAELLISELLNKYKWITLGYYDEQPKSLGDYKTKISSLLAANPKSKLEELESKLKHDVDSWEKFISNLSPEEKDIAKVASASTYLKDYYKFCMNKMMYYSEDLFSEVGKRLNISSAEVKDLWPEDIFDYINGKPINKERNDSFIKENVCLVEDQQFKYFVGDEARDFIDKYLTHNNHHHKEFKGRVASAGNVRGKAVVVQGPGEFHKMKEGNILVVVNTSPDYVPIMHLAKGIVSEEGGLTAHVSVVSREFRIPAIVGIRNICQIIKDGDEVELDTDNGIVRLI